jgi:hypothetical protein
MVAAAEHGLALDAIYTAKAYACAITAREENVLYWHTLSSAAADDPTEPLPPRLARLFR